MSMAKSSSLLAPIAKRLEGKVAVITGGASGMGAATAKLFVQHGAKVVIADVQNELGHSVCKEIGSDESISFVRCDVSNEQDVQHAVETAVAKHGKLDIMFSNAGTEGSIESTIAASDGQNLRRVLDVNLFGAFHCAKYAARAMIPAKRGSIVFTSSSVSDIAGLTPHAYTASKYAVLGLTKNLCVELGQHGIRVNCIAPHAMNTGMFRRTMGVSNEKADELLCEAANLKGVVFEAEHVAEAALYLGSDQSMYVSGLNMVIDGGYSTTNPSLAQVVRNSLQL
ncbi:short chain aldehyde dehydrogenase 1-like [Diospyros lotus]|uniref:short chain aldehyde dehydrogenase 1-like n=1 Tax=Diospyros lotus TaxID=55363 RepID=UPI00225631FF|nr:short chain aldehyde dehydrogenase 1-like [Diospyros lotus]XP_052172868.1 short chain aldehyde dehydrogenase 1-like [Diospyros lotus]